MTNRKPSKANLRKLDSMTSDLCVDDHTGELDHETPDRIGGKTPFEPKFDGRLKNGGMLKFLIRKGVDKFNKQVGKKIPQGK
eukprot:CAMPEP_0196577938 /NCGR_PEP_ID=MMETSP1081-20130531/6935_1 /TAXON_ID=36882 /ORGANISM="Pyramimonas amylifera, Strain CCMP720" /LENGTH=81 /DNA_ID=CAMNT_0041897003 /DNA_START=115 /DNA_END=360 /DNA_ORIENTATION=-